MLGPRCARSPANGRGYEFLRAHWDWGQSTKSHSPVAPAVGRPSYGYLHSMTVTADVYVGISLNHHYAPSAEDGRMSSHRLRLGRRSIVGQVYVMTTRCAGQSRWFDDPEAAEIVVNQLRQMDRSRCTHTLAWVVMPDHIHWMFELRSHSLAYVARRFKSSSALSLNRLKGRQGKVWQPGFFDHAVRADEALLRHAHYIVGNPIRAGITANIGDYKHAWCRWTL